MKRNKIFGEIFIKFSWEILFFFGKDDILIVGGSWR